MKRLQVRYHFLTVLLCITCATIITHAGGGGADKPGAGRATPSSRTTVIMDTTTVLRNWMIPVDSAGIIDLCNGSKAIIAGMRHSQKHHGAYSQRPGTCAYAEIHCAKGSSTTFEVHLINWEQRALSYNYFWNKTRQRYEMVDFLSNTLQGTTSIPITMTMDSIAARCEKLKLGPTALVTNTLKTTELKKIELPRRR